MPGLLKPVLDVFRKLVNNFFHVLHLFLSNPPLSSVQLTYLPIFIHSEAYLCPTWALGHLLSLNA